MQSGLAPAKERQRQQQVLVILDMVAFRCSSSFPWPLSTVINYLRAKRGEWYKKWVSVAWALGANCYLPQMCKPWHPRVLETRKTTQCLLQPPQYLKSPLHRRTTIPDIASCCMHCCWCGKNTPTSVFNISNPHWAESKGAESQRHLTAFSPILWAQKQSKKKAG